MTLPYRLAAHNRMMRDERAAAYQSEADPLFFKWQRGEDGVTEQEWVETVAAIRERFPYIEPDPEAE